jgi:copper chaperone CopZ
MNNDHYVHILDGRIRVKSQLVKQSPRKASEVERVLGAIRGVTSVSANPTTGSILVLFDPEVIEHRQLLAVLERNGYWKQGHALPASQNGRSGSVQMNNKIANALAKSVVEVGLQLLVSAVL